MWVPLFITALATAGASPPLAVQRTVTPWRTGRVIRERPAMDGVPYDGPPAVRLEAVDGTVWMKSNPLPASFPDSTVPSLSEQDSVRIIEAGWGRSRVGRGTLVVFPAEGAAKLAWRHTVRAIGGLWSVYVDAIDGEVIAAEADSWSARAWIYDTSPAVSDLITVELAGLYTGSMLRGEYVFSTKCTDWRIDPAPFGERVCRDWSFAAKPTLTGDFFSWPAEGELDDPFVQPNAYHHVDAIARWADERYGLRLDAPIQVFTNFPLTNAFFGDFDDDGDRDLSFGISDAGFNFGYDADVVHHEYGHALVRLMAGSMWMQADALGVDMTPGALNEGVADAFAMVLNPDPLLAEGLGRSDRWDEAIRDLERDRRCPDDLRGQVHRSGEIWGSTMWNMVDDPAIGPDLVGDIVVAAVSVWDNDTDWPDAAASVMTVAQHLLETDAISPETHSAIDGHIEASGMVDCARIIDLARVQHTRQVLLNLGLSAPYDRLAGGVQFMHRIPAESDGILLDIRDFDGASQGSGLAIYLRLDAPVEHEPSRIEGIGLHHATPVTYDALLELDEETGQLFVTEDTVPGLLDAGVLYGSLASINRRRLPLDADYMNVTIAATALQRTETVADRPVASGCSAVPRRPKFGLFIGLLGWLIVRKKRPARRLPPV